MGEQEGEGGEGWGTEGAADLGREWRGGRGERTRRLGDGGEQETPRRGKGRAGGRRARNCCSAEEPSPHSLLSGTFPEAPWCTRPWLSCPRPTLLAATASWSHLGKPCPLSASLRAWQAGSHLQWQPQLQPQQQGVARYFLPWTGLRWQLPRKCCCRPAVSLAASHSHAPGSPGCSR